MIREFIKVLYKYILKVLMLFGIDIAKKIDTKLRFGRQLDLKNPKTLADKVKYLELHKTTELQSICTDKFAVRSYIESKGLEKILIPLAGGVWDKVEDIDFNLLPTSFVLKATHGCRMNYVVSDKSKINVNDCKKELNKWLKTTYGTYSMEPHYLSIPHRLYAEQFLGEDMVDYKIHCLNGKTAFILVISERHNEKGKRMSVKIDIYDKTWNYIDNALQPSGKEVPGERALPKPENLEQMIFIAEKLAVDFPFVRVDLYNIDKKIYFGELTFSPCCCVFIILMMNIMKSLINC